MVCYAWLLKWSNILPQINRILIYLITFLFYKTNFTSQNIFKCLHKVFPINITSTHKGVYKLIIQSWLTLCCIHAKMFVTFCHMSTRFSVPVSSRVQVCTPNHLLSLFDVSKTVKFNNNGFRLRQNLKYFL